MSFSIENLEFFFMILVRISAFVATAPFFSQSNVPRRVKAFFAIFIAIVIFQALDYTPLAYEGVIGFAMLILKEALVGIMMGFLCQACMYVLDFAGHFIDVEIGFAMVMSLDPSTNLQTSITGTLYSCLVTLMLMITNMHHFILSAAVDSFRLVPIGESVFRPTLYMILSEFLSDYFVIAFRIILPVFCCILIVNVVLGILAKVAQQMNMFVIGMQLKIMMGLFIMFLTASFLPTISNFLFEEMKSLLSSIITSLAP